MQYRGILNVAKESDHPRGYEVAGNLIKHSCRGYRKTW